MNKNSQPYSEPRNLKLALVSSFIYFASSGGLFVGQIQNETDWHDIPCVPGTLQVSCQPNESGFYDVNISFRVSFADPENQAFMNIFRHAPLVARYTSGAGKEKLAGTAENFLKLNFGTPPGFDGYECTLKGTQKDPELFIPQV